MKPVPRGPTLVLLAWALATCSTEARAQDPCPSASGPDAEAGWAAYADNDMIQARRRFEAAIGRCGNDHYARTGLAYVDLRDGNDAEAERLWSVVIAAEPNNVDALVGLGLARWRAGDIDAVRDRFTTVLDLAPGHPTATEYLERVAGAEAAATMPADRADEAWRNGNTALAMRLYSDRLAEDSSDLTAMLRVALMRAWQEEYRPAVELLDRLIDVQPGHLDARLARARVKAWSGDIGAAQDEVLQILGVRPDYAEALEALALFQAWAGQLDESLASYDELLSIAPGSGSAQRQQAQAFAWSSRFEASRAAYDALLARDPDDLEARLGLARTMAFSRDFNGAIAQYDQVLARSPALIPALLGKSKTLGWAGRLIDSERVALLAIESDPRSAEAWGGLGQVYRWQGRNLAALEALETAADLGPTNAEIRDQLRSVRLTFAPLAHPTVVYEDDSDGNRMVTTSLTASWHPTPSLDVRAEGYYKDLEQGLFARTAQGVTMSGAYRMRSGWLLGGGLGGSRSDGTGDPSLLEYRLRVRTPDKHPLGVGLTFSSSGLNETASLAELGVRSTQVVLSGRLVPALGWRVDGTVGVGEYDGTESNGRRSASLSASRAIGRSFSLGASARGFSFEKNLSDGYFDPDFYGILELTSYWLYRPTPWTVLLELAPGIQQVTKDGDPGTSLRSNARLAYRIGPGREVSLSFGYSTAGLMSFATGGSNYRYTAIILGSNWVF